jgi:Golgi nucleoside diphosphatase
MFIQTMSVSTDGSFKIARRLLSMLGLWIEQDERPVTWKAYLQWISQWFCFFACILLISASTFDIAYNDRDFKRKTQFMLLLCQQISILQLFYVLKTKKDMLWVLIKKTFQDIQVRLLNI